MNQPARATSIKELEHKFALAFNEADRKQGLKLTLRPSDVVISPFAKCGTTWLQQIVHCLRTRGDMDFDDISRVIPWIETSGVLGIDLDAEQKAEPRAFKSHLAWGEIPEGGRYIVALRDPRDALFSIYKFMEGWFFEPGSVTLDDYAQAFFIEGRAYWKHLNSWWPRRNDPDVLLLAFENMKTDLAGSIERVARFIDINLDDELAAITAEHASLTFMQQHKDKFDDKLTREMSEPVASLPTGSDSAKVRAGQVGEHARHLSAELARKLDGIWQQEVCGSLGFRDYKSLVVALD